MFFKYWLKVSILHIKRYAYIHETLRIDTKMLAEVLSLWWDCGIWIYLYIRLCFILYVFVFNVLSVYTINRSNRNRRYPVGLIVVCTC